MNKTQGFTLIELLVVVLIIGILSAIALPQYTAAVEKTRAMTLLSTLSAIARAEEVFYLANNAYTSDLYDLDIQPSADGTVSGSLLTFPNGNSISMATGGSGYLAGATRYVQIDIALKYTANKQLEPGIFCFGKTDDPISLKICAAMGEPTDKLNTCGLLPGSPKCRQFNLN